MVIRRVHPALLEYLHTVQRSTKIGFRDLIHAAPGRKPRTVRHWRCVLGRKMHIIPNVATETIGLLHLHAILRASVLPTDLPYVAEPAPVTLDLATHEWYVHLLVPISHQRYAAHMLERYPVRYVAWSASGWQHFPRGGEDVALPIPGTGSTDSEFLQRSPFVIPALLECYAFPNTMPMIWARAHARLGTTAWNYLRRRPRVVNGKNHVREAFQTLERSGIIQQHIIRYHPLLAGRIELFLNITLHRDRLLPLLRLLREHIVAYEAYPTTSGYFLRLVASYDVLDAINALPAEEREHIENLGINTKLHAPTMMSFDYRRHFDPRTGTWRPPPEE